MNIGQEYIDKKLSIIPQKYKRFIRPKLFAGMLDFLAKNPGWEDRNAKLFGCITADDVETMGEMIETKWCVGEDNAYQACKHLVDGAGKIPKIPLYRGISIEDYENICQCGKSLAAYTLSFTPSKDVAMSFANSSGKVIEVYSKDVRMFDTYEFGVNFDLACAATYSNSTDEVDDQLYRNGFDYMYIEKPEFEWICMRDVEFVPINKEKTKFYVVKPRRLNERMCNMHTRRQIQEAIAYWTKVLNESEEDYEDEKFKIWIDDVRPAPYGYKAVQSVNQFIDFAQKAGIDNIVVVDIDHDAGDFQKDGGDYIKILDWLELNNAENLNVRIHSANPVGAANMRRIIRKNGWTEIFDVVKEDEQDAQQWLVDFSDDEDGKQTAAFSSKQEASTWIRNREMQDRYDPTGFEVLKGPYLG